MIASPSGSYDAAAIESDRAGADTDLIRTCIRNRSIVAGANRAGQNFIPDAWNVDRYCVLHTVVAFHVVLRTHEVAELEARHNAAGVDRLSSVSFMPPSRVKAKRSLSGKTKRAVPPTRSAFARLLR